MVTALIAVLDRDERQALARRSTRVAPAAEAITGSETIAGTLPALDAAPAAG